MSPSNPFLTRLQSNPFFEELLAEEALKSPPAAGYPGSPLSQYAAHLANPSLPSPAHRGGMRKDRAGIKRERPRSVARQRSLPVLLPGSSGSPASSLPNSSTNRSLSENITEWDESFEAFAASRLKSPNDTPSAPNSTTTPDNYHAVPDISGGGRKGFPQPTEVPPLPPRRPAGAPSKDRSSQSWLGSAEELAVQREACFLTQSDLASRQHVRERKHRRNTKSWTLGEEPPAESTLWDLHSDPEHHYVNMCFTSAISEVAESSDVNNRTQTSGEHGWKAGSSERDSPDAQERRNMERKNNALNSSHFDMNKDVVLNMALGFATENILDRSPLSDDKPVTSPLLVNIVTSDSEKPHKAHKDLTHTELEPLDKSLCELSLRPDCPSDHSDKTKVTNGISSFVVTTPESVKNIDSCDFAFVDSDSSPSDMTINTFEIYDQNANKMLTAFQMVSTVDSSGKPVSTPVTAAVKSDLKASELEMLSSTTPSFSVCETKQVSEPSVLKADSLHNEQGDCSPHYKSSRGGKGGCQAHGNTSFEEEIRLDFGDARHTSFNCELPNHPLNPRNQAGNVIGAEIRGTELTSSTTNCINSCTPLGLIHRDNDSFTDALCNKDGCVSSELSLRALPLTQACQRPSQSSDQQSTLFDQSVVDNTRSDADPTGEVGDTLGGGSQTDEEPQPGESENSEGSPALQSDQEMSFADLHARVAPRSSNSIRPTGSLLHESPSSSSSPTQVTDTSAKPDPSSPPDPNTSPQNAIPKAGGTHNLVSTTSSSSCSCSSSSTFTSAAISSCSSCPVQSMVDARHTVTPGETQPASGFLPHQESR